VVRGNLVKFLQPELHWDAVREREWLGFHLEEGG